MLILVKKIRCFLPLAISGTIALGVANEQNDASSKHDSPVGDWRGISACQVKPNGCRDEDSLYHCKPRTKWDSLIRRILPRSKLSGPLLPFVTAATTVIVRSAQSPESLAGSLRQAVNALDGNAVVYDVRTMHQVIGATMAERRFSMALLGTFAGIGLLLAVIGIYGVVSYLVGRRTHEIGIRMALGAQPRDILRDTLGQGAQMTLAGIALGLAASFGLTRLMTSMLFGVSATDPLTFAAVVAVLLSVALVACYIPARRAMRVDPMVALRHE